MDWMSSFLAFPVDEIPFIFLVLLLSFAVHEFAHAVLADKFGDPTPRSMGRVTLNPRVHIDWLGMIFFLVIGVGWSKPTLVNRAKFSNPRLMGLIVSFAGPLSNLVLGFLSLALFLAMQQFGWLEGMNAGVQAAILTFMRWMVVQNVFLFILNLIPFPALDGYRILEDLLPRPWAQKLHQYQQWLFYAVLLMFFIPPLRAVTLGPIFALQGDILALFTIILAPIFGVPVKL
ncbi:site-2 protease family protein [Paenibacillus sp. YYML68]|uniref:site-2 protease family protein n=1 Tax=Paenibacillus sp. YYML68 TaxID=2909250 RepID=UPI00249122CE|nr:site-2 protease family protein [Paenibacillus sp. YYML68]